MGRAAGDKLVDVINGQTDKKINATSVSSCVYLLVPTLRKEQHVEKHLSHGPRAGSKSKTDPGF